MSAPTFKVTLDNTVKGSLDVSSDTFGFEDFELKLERDKTYHSLVQVVETPLIFRGAAKDYILDVRNNQGPNDKCTIQIDISYDDGDSYDNIFDGLIMLHLIKKHYIGSVISDIQAPLQQNSFWQKFLNGIDKSVQIGSTTDIYGNTIETINSHTLDLFGQPVKKLFKSEIQGTGSYLSESYSFNQSNLTRYYVINLSRIVYNEWDEYFEYPSQFGEDDAPTDLKYMWKIKKGGSYSFDVDYFVKFVSDNYSSDIDGWTHDIYFDIYSYDDTLKSRHTIYSNSGTELDSHIEDSNSSNYSTTETLEPGDKVYLYGKWFQETIDTGGGAGTATWGVSFLTDTQITVSFKDTYADTSIESYKIHEVANSICDQIIGQNGAFYSERLGNTSTQIQSYGSDGDMSYKALSQGINVRGKTFSDKPFYMSFKQWWEGINPICNLALGYETISSVDVIRVEAREEFFDDDPQLSLGNIDNLEEDEDDKIYVKSVEFGYKKWKSEELGALDDPQTKQKAVNIFENFGEDEKILSEFYAASIGIEQARRRNTDQEDYKLDDEIMIFELERTSQSDPDTNQDFDIVSNLNYSTERYNIKLSTKRILLRNFNWLNQGLIYDSGVKWQFSGGEGNYKMSSSLDYSERGDYDNNTLAEDDDIVWDYNGPTFDDDTRPILKPIINRFNEYPLSKSDWDTLVANRKKSIEISTTDSGHWSVFIDFVKWKPYYGKADFECHQAY